MDKFDRFLDSAERLMERLERTLPKFATGRTPDWPKLCRSVAIAPQFRCSFHS